jgi:hypothetical protein
MGVNNLYLKLFQGLKYSDQFAIKPTVEDGVAAGEPLEQQSC